MEEQKTGYDSISGSMSKLKLQVYGRGDVGRKRANEAVTSTHHSCRKFAVPPPQVLVWVDAVQCDNTVTHSF